MTHVNFKDNLFFNLPDEVIMKILKEVKTMQNIEIDVAEDDELAYRKQLRRVEHQLNNLTMHRDRHYDQVREQSYLNRSLRQTRGLWDLSWHMLGYNTGRL